MSMRPAATSSVRSAYESLRARVLRVAQVHRRSAVTEGVGKLSWRIGLPLLIVVLLQAKLGLPFWLRVPVLPFVGVAILWLGWRLIVQPLLERYSITRAALLVETRRPQLSSRLVSALECYHDLGTAQPRFDGGMVEALVLHASSSTASDDFTQVIDRKQVRRQLFAGGAVLALWVAAFIAAPRAMAEALGSMGSAWGEVRNIIQKVGGAGIDIDPPEKQAYLRGDTITLRARAHGFSPSDMKVFTRREGQQQWTSADAMPADGSDSGRFAFVQKDASDSFEIYFASGRIESEHKSVIVTEKPRIANLSVEYDLPDYTAHAPIIQARSDGNLETVYGSTIILTIRANKPIAAGELKIFKQAGGQTVPLTAERLTIGGDYARAVIRLSGSLWMPGSNSATHAAASTQPASDNSYSLTLIDKYGNRNDTADQLYKLAVTRDQPPEVHFIGLPHRMEKDQPKDEPHLLEQRMSTLGAVVRASDDYGISKLTLHYLIQDLDTDVVKRATRGDWPDAGNPAASIAPGGGHTVLADKNVVLDDPPQKSFPLPRVDIPQAVLLRFSDLHLVAGERIVFWAEAEDAYDLGEGPDKGRHHTLTPRYKIAVVAQEESFSEVVYKDDWSTQWYDSLKVATLTKREIPPRQSPDREPAAEVAGKLPGPPQNGDNVQGADRQLVQDYFDSLNVLRK